MRGELRHQNQLSSYIHILFSLQIHITSESHSDGVRDIEDTTHYSLEDAKQKAEHDRKMKAAEAKKQQVLILTCFN